MKTLSIASNLSLPIDIAGQTIGLVGIRGSGKTNTAGVIAEELLDHHQPIVVLDPTDAWWGLRSGYPVFIFGGPHGDIPLNEHDGKLIAEFLVTEQVPVILSLRHLRKNAQRRFVTDFSEELYHLKGKDKYRQPLTVFIDEAPLFVPQKVMGEVARTVGAVEDLIARGRNSGFGVVLISQRPATINKDVLTQADTIITHRLTSPQDRKALGEWIEENATVEKHKEILSSLAGMPNGKAWIWSPRLDIMVQAQIRLRHTFDSSASPKVGQKVTTPKNLKDIDLGKLKDKLAQAVESKKANDPKVLQARITELEKQVAKAPTTVKTTPDTTTIENAVRKAIAKERADFKKFLYKVSRPLHALVGRADELQKQFTGLNTEIDQYIESQDSQTIDAPKVNNIPTEERRPTNLPRGGAVRVPTASGDTRTASQIGKGGLYKILVVLAQAGTKLTYSQVGARAGVSVRGGTFRVWLSQGRTCGWLETDQGALWITDQGLAELGDFEPLPVGDALREYWLQEVGNGGAHKILKILIEDYPNWLSYDEIAQRAGVSAAGGTFRVWLSELRTKILIETNKGQAKASDELFEN